MGITSENVAERYGVTRYAQDDMAARSHKHAAHARAQGYFDSEIVPTKAVTVVRFLSHSKTVHRLATDDPSLYFSIPPAQHFATSLLCRTRRATRLVIPL